MATPPSKPHSPGSSNMSYENVCNAQRERSFPMDLGIIRNTSFQKQEHMNDKTPAKAKAITEQVTTFGAAEEATKTAETVRYGEISEAGWHQSLRKGSKKRSPTSSMEVPKLRDRSSEETRSSDDTLTITPSTRGTSLGEGEGEGEIPEERAMDFPPQEDTALLYISNPRTPLSIVEQACWYADQSPVRLTDEQFASFRSQPPDAQQHALKVYFKELASLELILE